MAELNPEKMTDWELLQWAIKNAGWKFHYINDQIESASGGLTTFVNRSDMGIARRQQIADLIRASRASLETTDAARQEGGGNE